MKKTNKKNSKMRKLLPAFAMLTVSAISLSSATYAWFTMNKEVTVTGMQLRTKVGDNLLIVQDDLDSTAKKSDSAFKTAVVDTMSALLEPVSTINGTSFFYTDTFNVAGDGSAITQTYKAYTEPTSGDTAKLTNTNAHKTYYDANFQRNYGNNSTVDASNVAYGYVDYVFQIKANNTSDAAKYINITNLTLTHGANETSSIHAFRTAVFAEDITNTDPDGGVGTLKTILSTEGDDDATYYFTDTKAVAATTGTILDTVSNYSDDAVIGTVNPGTDAYYKVVVRIWLEGEDELCNNTTFSKLEDTWALDLKIEMKDANTGSSNVVNAITAVATPSKLGINISTDTLTTTGDTVKNISGIAYYPIGSKTINSNQLYTTDNTLTVNSRVYTIADGTHPTDVTNQVTITAGT